MIQSSRPRKCACGCGVKFFPSRPLQKAATPECALRISQQKREKEERKQLRARRIEAKPLSWWKSKAQAAVNAYVRERDREYTCISCGRWHDGQWHAGHFLSVGAQPAIRFHEDNIHKQCQPCNEHKSGNHAEYRPRLIAKIGLKRVEWLEGPHPAAHFTREDCQRIEAEYKAKVKALKVKKAA